MQRLKLTEEGGSKRCGFCRSQKGLILSFIKYDMKIISLLVISFLTLSSDPYNNPLNIHLLVIPEFKVLTSEPPS